MSEPKDARVVIAKQAASLLKAVKGGARVLLRIQRGSGAEFLSLEIPRSLGK